MIKTSNKIFILHGISCATYSLALNQKNIVFANVPTHISQEPNHWRIVFAVRAMCHLRNGRHEYTCPLIVFIDAAQRNCSTFRVNPHLMSGRVRAVIFALLLLNIFHVDNTLASNSTTVEYSHSSLLLLLSLVWCRESESSSQRFVFFFRSHRDPHEPRKTKYT